MSHTLFRLLYSSLKSLAFVSLLFLVGCASSDENNKQLNALAKNRAAVLAASLPLDHGPLSIISAKAKKNRVEIVMIYNQDEKGALPIQTIYAQTEAGYCSSDDIIDNLELGLAYNIKIRSPRGKLLVDSLISKSTCLKGGKS